MTNIRSDPHSPPPTSGDDAIRDYIFLVERAVSGHNADPDDARQDALMALWQAGESWSREGEFRSYAYQRMKWAMVNGHRRRNGRRGRGNQIRQHAIPSDTLPEVPWLDPDYSYTVYGTELLTAVLAACESPRDRLFVQLRLEGHSNRQIAVVMGCDPSYITHIAHHIHDRLAI